jgi:hypothetical protein
LDRAQVDVLDDIANKPEICVYEHSNLRDMLGEALDDLRCATMRNEPRALFEEDKPNGIRSTPHGMVRIFAVRNAAYLYKKILLHVTSE